MQVPDVLTELFSAGWVGPGALPARYRGRPILLERQENETAIGKPSGSPTRFEPEKIARPVDRDERGVLRPRSSYFEPSSVRSVALRINSNYHEDRNMNSLHQFPMNLLAFPGMNDHRRIKTDFVAV
jgi:hypothetical protein